MDVTVIVALFIGVYVGWLLKKTAEAVKPQIALLKELWATMPFKKDKKEGVVNGKQVGSPTVVDVAARDGKPDRKG